jgi:hypothetical protein
MKNFGYGTVEAVATTTAPHIHATSWKSALTVQQLLSGYLVCISHVCENSRYSTTHALLLHGRTYMYPPQ